MDRTNENIKKGVYSMNRISKIVIKGYKRFENITINFNDELSVLVGENEVGKSTILEAIDLVLNPSFYNYGDGSLSQSINKNLANLFFRGKTPETLPKIEIELLLNIENHPKAIDFSGLHYSSENNGELKTGIKFKYEFDEQFTDILDFESFANNKIIPTEYYSMTWNTFQGKPYKRAMAPIKMIYIDNSKIKHDIYGTYSKKIFKANLSKEEQRELSTSFKSDLTKFKEDHKDKLKLEDNQFIGLDESKTDLLKLIDIFDGEVSIQDMGSGQENLIKTKLALSDNVFDLVLIDEPEIHLSFTNTRKLIEMVRQISGSQVVLATHSSLIVNRLHINNTIWLSDTQSHSLKNLSEETATFFEKNDNFDILRYVLAKNVILVEGAAEYIMLPEIYKKINSVSIDEDQVDIISMGSISYNRFKEISEHRHHYNKTLVFTDNDKEKVEYDVTDNFKIYADESVENWTLEVAFYNYNRPYFDNLYEDRNTKPEYKGISIPKAQAHMLKNKTDNAIEIEKAVIAQKLCIPEYISEGVKWIRE